LKQQLAAQEVELNKKNEEADKLIEIVGIETERVRIIAIFLWVIIKWSVE
jgi:hypothetical protein